MGAAKRYPSPHRIPIASQGVLMGIASLHPSKMNCFRLRSLSFGGQVASLAMTARVASLRITRNSHSPVVDPVLARQHALRAHGLDGEVAGQRQRSGEMIDAALLP